MAADDRLLSLNEVDGLAAKALRGAGFGWGQAEDGGRAARWLAERSLAWCEPLLGLVEDAAARLAFDNALALADRVAGTTGPATWTTPPCRLLWALPAVAAALHGRVAAVRLTAEDHQVCLRPEGASSSHDLRRADPRPHPLAVDVVGPDRAAPLPYGLDPCSRRSAVSPAMLEALSALAARTYVPATAQSRSRGAGGAGLDD